MKSENVVRKTMSAISSSQRKYEEWSGGLWLWQAPEYIATTLIAQSIVKLDEVGYVTLENSVKSAVKHAGGSRRGRPQTLLSKGRFDVTVWNKRAEPKGLIEVKTSVWGFKSLEKDLNRLCATLEKAKMIKWGLVAYFLSYSDSKQALAKDRVKRSSELIFQNAVSYLEESRKKVNHHRGSIRTAGDSAWTAEVLEVVRR